MFHTFESFESPGNTAPIQESSSHRRQSVSKRVTTVRACTSCRQRKIKCDGNMPCEACRWYKKADLCQYSDPRPSRRHVEKLSTTLDEYRSILEKLFPDKSPESLITLPRESLLKLISQEDLHKRSQIQHEDNSPIPALVEPRTFPITTRNENLELLQTIPDEIEYQSPDNTGITDGVSDDVNALSLSIRRASSYLGVSSIHAVLKVIVWLDSGSLSYLSRIFGQTGNSHQQPIPLSQPFSRMNDTQLIDAFFTNIHPFVPMLDEQGFRQTYSSGFRKDDRWLGLLNIVLALGSIAASTADDKSHQTYFERSKAYLGLESLGNSHLETVQTLGLIGGLYLHYTSQPNLAYALMGAALRMAAALGLHKEFSNSSETKDKHKLTSINTKRRVWWSLFCMDTLGSMTLGRPSMGRSGSAITVNLPSFNGYGNVLEMLLLLENIRFCNIATQIQEALAVAPLVDPAEISYFDNKLLEWYNSIPSIIKDDRPCSEPVQVVKTVMRWRYFNQRMLLYRPTLLCYAMRRVPYISLRAEERTSIEMCREIAEATIQDISTTAHANQMSGWNAVWLMFQAVMIPLLGLFLDDNTAYDTRASFKACQMQIDVAMVFLERMQSWSPTAKRTLDFVSGIREASKRHPDLAVNIDRIDAKDYTPVHDYIHHSTPPSFPTHVDMSGGMIYANEGLPTHPDPQDFNYSVDQNFWDYLSWSDSGTWPGVSDFENANDPAIQSRRNDMKYWDHNTAIFNNMSEPAYFTSHSRSI